MGKKIRKIERDEGNDGTCVLHIILAVRVSAFRQVSSALENSVRPFIILMRGTDESPESG